MADAFLICSIIDAVFGVIVGWFSDAWRSKLVGRRHGFMYMSILPVAICTMCLFNPQWANLGYSTEWPPVASPVKVCSLANPVPQEGCEICAEECSAVFETCMKTANDYTTCRNALNSGVAPQFATACISGCVYETSIGPVPPCIDKGPESASHLSLTCSQVPKHTSNGATPATTSMQ